MSGYEFGNTRLRARRGRLLGPADYAELVLKDVDGLLVALARGNYAADLEAAATRAHGLDQLLLALGRHLERQLREMHGFYDGDAADAVSFLLHRWDRTNLLTLLRGAKAQLGSGEIRPMLVALGAFDGAILDELSRCGSVRALIDMLVSFRLPTGGVSRALLDAWPAYEVALELAILEQAALGAQAAELSEALGGGGDRKLLRRFLLGDVEQARLVGALRMRAARLAGEAIPTWAEELGSSTRRRAPDRIPGAVLAAVTHSRTREEACGLLEPGIPAAWRPPLRRWMADGDAVRLADGLRDQLARDAAALIRSADPLGVGVPIAFTFGLETEVRNLRLIALARAQGLAPEGIQELLVVL